MQWLKLRYPRVWGFLAARFARGEYLGLHLTVGFAISVAALWLFGVVTEDVIQQEPLTRFDVTVLDWLRARVTPAGAALWQAISHLGSPLTITGIAIAGAVLLALRRRWTVLGGWVAAFAGGGLLDATLKFINRRPRPLEPVVLAPESWSFPSGHAMGSLIGYGMLAYVLVVLWIQRPWLRVAVILTAGVLVLAVGVSRLYLGVHYFSDVVGGYAAGIVWLGACISGLEVVRRWRAGSAAAPVPPAE